MSDSEDDDGGALDLEILRRDWDEEYLRKKRVCALSVNDAVLSNLIRLLDDSEVLETLYLMCDAHTLGNEDFADALSTNATLKSLVVFQGRGQSGIGAGGAKMLASALKGNVSLEYLTLNDQRIGDKGAECIAETLTCCREHLKVVSLRNNNIGDDGARDLGLKLMTGSALHVDLSENCIGDGGTKELCSTALLNGKLQRFLLNANEIGDEGGKKLASVLSFNEIVHIELHENNLSKGAEEMIRMQDNESRRESRVAAEDYIQSLGMLDIESAVGTMQTVQAMSNMYSWAFTETDAKSSDGPAAKRARTGDDPEKSDTNTHTADKESSTESDCSDLDPHRSTESNKSEESDGGSLAGCRQKLEFTYDWQEKFEELAKLAQDGPVGEEVIAKLRNR